MKRVRELTNSERGITLVEMLIVLALIGILLAVVVPNLAGFLSRGNDRAYDTDRQNIQAAVDAYYSDTKARPGVRKYPNTSGAGGSAGSTTYINFTWLTDGRYLRESPQSSSSDNTGGGSGTYSWYIDSNGTVQSGPAYNGKYP